MDLIGLCQICGKPGEMFSCTLCGKIICSTCYDKINRICVNCRIYQK